MGAEKNLQVHKYDRRRKSSNPEAAELLHKVAVATPEAMGVAVTVVCHYILERMEQFPGSEPAKLSLAMRPGGEWVASVNDWIMHKGLAAFKGHPGRALVELAERLVRGDEWRDLPKRS